MDYNFWQRQKGYRLQQRYGRRDCQFRRRLMAEMAVWAMRIIARALVMPIADNAGREDQQHQQR